MPTFEGTIPVADAPKAPQVSQKDLASRTEFEGYVQAVTSAPGTAGKVTLVTEGENKDNPRAVMIRLQRAAQRLKQTIQVWRVGNEVYFKVKEPAKNGAKA